MNCALFRSDVSGIVHHFKMYIFQNNVFYTYYVGMIGLLDRLGILTFWSITKRKTKNTSGFGNVHHMLYTSDFFIFLFIRNVSHIRVVNLYEEIGV